MIKYLVAFISITFGAFAQYLFKKGVQNIKQFSLNEFISLGSNLYIWGGMMLYGLSLLMWFYVLSKIELSKAYPLVSIGYIFTAILGYYLLNESLTPSKFFGIFLIVLGVVVISK